MERACARAGNQRVDLLLEQAIARRSGAATSATQIAPNRSDGSATMPGVARNIPMTAVKTMSDSTRGLVRAKNWRSRSGRVETPLIVARVTAALRRPTTDERTEPRMSAPTREMKVAWLRRVSLVTSVVCVLRLASHPGHRSSSASWRQLAGFGPLMRKIFIPEWGREARF
jgi:hypothetical protein